MGIWVLGLFSVTLDYLLPDVSTNDLLLVRRHRYQRQVVNEKLLKSECHPMPSPVRARDNGQPPFTKPLGRLPIDSPYYEDWHLKRPENHKELGITIGGKLIT